MIAAVIFDLDGTLIDSFAGMIATARQVLAEAGYPVPSVEHLHRQLRRGLTLAEVFPSLGLDPPQSAVLLERYRERYLEETVLQVRPFPEAQPCLAALAAAGFPLAVATAKRQDAALKALVVTGLLPYFQAVVGQDGVSPSKPHPAIVEHLAARLGRPPAQCLVVGDSLADIQMGKAAGAWTCGVLAGEPFDELRQLQPDWLIDRLSELPPLLGLA
ncbi:MAG: phosphoglycolate phosphatase [Dehalococcoidia bacterium]|nr:MAG: phosphoglycolate phosphatase [Dehalococcoidia bacterium]